jgi:hypothetical protein
VSPQRLRISTPRYRLAEFRSEEYLVRAFPGSQVAGIVKRLKDSDVRRLAPLYFFRIPLAPDLQGQAGSRLRERSQADDRTVLMVDTFDRFVHVLHFPDKETRGAQFELFLDEQGSCDADAVASER